MIIPFKKENTIIGSIALLEYSGMIECTWAESDKHLDNPSNGSIHIESY